MPGADEPLKDALSWFGAAARQWGEEKARADSGVESRKGRGRAGVAGVQSRGGAGLAQHVPQVGQRSASLFFFFSASGMPRWKAHRAAIEAQATATQQEQKQELARDNTLLEEVDQDVSQVVPEAMQPLSWNTANSSAAERLMPRRHGNSL